MSDPDTSHPPSPQESTELGETLYRSQLNEPWLRALITDIAELTDVQAIIPKSNQHQLTSGNMDLTCGLEGLLTRTLRGLQIRYVYEGEEWWDTLIHDDQGIRLTRILCPCQ